MAEPRKSLHISEDIEFQQFFWRVQRFGWLAMLAIVILAIAGFLGDSYFSIRRVGNGQISAEYERFARYESPSSITFRLENPGEGSVRLWIDRNYIIDGVEVETIMPTPERVEAEADMIIYTIQTHERDSIEVKFDMRPQIYGTVDISAGLIGGRSIRFRQFVFP